MFRTVRTLGYSPMVGATTVGCAQFSTSANSETGDGRVITLRNVAVRLPRCGPMGRHSPHHNRNIDQQ